jgi:HAMP domain-containing protein
MIGFIRRSLSVQLSLLLTLLMIPSLGIVAVIVVMRETQVVEDAVLDKAKTAALQGAFTYGMVLDAAVDSRALSVEEILSSDKEVVPFPFHVEEARYKTKVSVYVRAHGVQQWEDAARTAGGFLFFSGMDLNGMVPVTNSFQDLPPRGDSTPEDAAWDRLHSRGGRQYRGGEQLKAVEFEVSPDGATTKVQPYLRDTGEWAWDVSAPIYVKGHHFGGLRIGVARDAIVQQYRTLVIGLLLLFGMVAIAFTTFVLLFTRAKLKPLSDLARKGREMSMCSDYEELGVRITMTDRTEIGDMAKSLDRLRASLHEALRRLAEKDQL